MAATVSAGHPGPMFHQDSQHAVVMQPGWQPVNVQSGSANSNVVYYVMSAPVNPQTSARPSPKFDYVPNDYLPFSIGTAVVVGTLSPITLVFSLIAIYCSWKSKVAKQDGDIKTARNRGMKAAYFNLTAIAAALLVATILIAVVFGVYGPEYSRQQCINRLQAQGSWPPTSTRTSFSCT